MKKITMSAAWQRRGVRLAAGTLVGCPVGGWAETMQAKRAIVDELPSRAERDWSVADFLDAVFEINAAERYVFRASWGL